MSAINKNEIIEKVLEGYRSSYDVTVMETQGADFIVAKAQMHETESGFVLTRKAEMWSASNHEYVWFYSVPNLSADFAQKAIEQVNKEGLELIDWKNNKNHMCSRLSVVFFCDDADAAALDIVKKCKIYKSFQFSLKGWMEVHTAALVTGTEQVVSNRYGKATGEYLKTVLHPEMAKKKGGNKLHILKNMLD